jgi:signal transduction histidine kinase/CheY-like chemotaxis protein
MIIAQWFIRQRAVIRDCALMSWIHHSNLIWRFLLIGLIAVSPLIGALIQIAGDERDLALKASRERAELLISYATQSQRSLLDETRSALKFIAEAEEAKTRRPECERFLARHVALHRWLTALRLHDVDGAETCSNKVGASAENLSGHDFFQKAAAGSDVVLSELIVDGETNQPAMMAAVPVFDGGQLVGVLSARIRPGFFEDHSLLQLHPGLDVTMFVVDRKGALFAHYPPLRQMVGANLQDQPAVRHALATPSGSADSPDFIGTSRLFVYRTLPGADAVLAIGINRASVLGAVDQTLRYRLFLIILIITGSLLLGLLGAESLIFRPLRSLTTTAEALERGNFGALPAREGAGEVRILARVLKRMAQAVADRERELKAAKELAERALEDARVASQAKSDFLASMSHEIRTPLNGIIGYTERLLDEDLTASQKRSVQLIQVAGSALLTVANDILDFSSIEADRIELENEPFSLAALIDNTVSIVSNDAQKKGVPIRIEFDADVPDIVTGDEARLRQVILNLLNNAVKFTREGHITARVQYKGPIQNGEVIKVSIIDTGIGIAPEKHSRLFRRFSQVDRSIRREFGGTGLGLAISKRLIELMGGTIGVDSQIGQGSTFWIEVTLPRAVKSLPMPVSHTADMPPARILLAEDLEINQELARSLLEACGHEVDVVADGESAVATVQTKAYDLVLMDIQMPGMDGMSATRMIRALDHPAKHVLVVAMTANVLPQQVQAFKEAGINDHIGKPVRRDDLLRKLRDWLPATADRIMRPDGADKLPHFDRKAYEEFRRIIGDSQADQWRARLDAALDEFLRLACNGDTGRERLAQTAHALISQAALLGFPDLAASCTALERACHEGQDPSFRLKQAIRAAATSRAIIANATQETPGRRGLSVG